MAIPKNITFVTFDVYGTLIDWETGAYDAFEAEAERDGFTIERDELIPLFHEIQRQIQAGSYELYAEVLRRTAVQIAKKLGWPLEPSRSGFLPDSVERWPPFRETNPVLQKIAKKRNPSWRIYEVPVSYSGRTYEEGKKIGLKDAVQAFCCIVRYWLCN